MTAVESRVQNEAVANIWSEYPACKGTFGSHKTLTAQTLSYLRNNNNVRQMARRSTSGTRVPFITNSTKIWADNVKMYLEKMQNLQEICDKYSPPTPKTVSLPECGTKDGLLQRKTSHKLSRVAQITQDSPTDSDSFHQALQRTRGIILPEALHPDLHNRVWKTRKLPRHFESYQYQQPQIDLEFHGDGDAIEVRSDLSSQDFRRVPESESETTTTSDGTIEEIDPEKLSREQDFDAYFCGAESGVPMIDLPKARPATPTWHKYRLPKQDVCQSCRETGEKRRVASKFVMADLVNRKKAHEAKDQRNAEEMMRKKKDNLKQIKKKRFAEVTEQKLKDLDDKRKYFAKRQRNSISNDRTSVGMIRQDTVEQLYSKDFDLDKELESIQSFDNYLEVGLRADMKLRVIKDFMRTKRWHPEERGKLTKLNDLVDYWTKVARKSTETGGLPDTRAWVDDNEKKLFADLIDHIRERKAFTKFDPVKILQTAYLRLGKETVRALEKMCRDMGKDPGIHVHGPEMNIFDMNVFQESSLILHQENVLSNIVEAVTGARSVHGDDDDEEDKHQEVPRRLITRRESYLKSMKTLAESPRRKSLYHSIS